MNKVPTQINSKSDTLEISSVEELSIEEFKALRDDDSSIKVYLHKILVSVSNYQIKLIWQYITTIYLISILDKILDEILQTHKTQPKYYKQSK